jgi:hypothetical protein
MLTRHFVAAGVVLFAASAARAEMYKTVGPDGKITVSNIAPAVKPAQALRTGERDPGGKIMTPDVIGAVSNVMGVAHLVSSSREFCAATIPARQQRFASAAQGWGLRNSEVVAHKDRILAHPVQQLIAEALNADMARKTASLMQPVKQSSPAERVEWCDKAFADVDRGVLDLVGRPSIAPMMKYGRR